MRLSFMVIKCPLDTHSSSIHATMSSRTWWSIHTSSTTCPQKQIQSTCHHTSMHKDLKTSPDTIRVILLQQQMRNRDFRITSQSVAKHSVDLQNCEKEVRNQLLSTSSPGSVGANPQVKVCPMQRCFCLFVNFIPIGSLIQRDIGSVIRQAIVFSGVPLDERRGVRTWSPPKLEQLQQFA